MAKLKRKLGEAMLLNDIKRFSDRIWLSEENKQMLRLIKSKNLNLAPVTLYNLDHLGLNYLEIIDLSSTLGEVIHKLPAEDVDFLNDLESKFNICFAYDKKVNNKFHLAKVDCFYAGFNSAGFYPTLSSALFGIDLYI